MVLIQMKFQLVLRNIFKEYSLYENMFPNEESCQMRITEKNVENQLNKFTIIIEDTYSMMLKFLRFS